MLITENNLAAPDDFYEALIDAHRDLSNEQSQEMNAALILLLANHLGDMAVLREALAPVSYTHLTLPTSDLV